MKVQMARSGGTFCTHESSTEGQEKLNETELHAAPYRQDEI